MLSRFDRGGLVGGFSEWEGALKGGLPGVIGWEAVATVLIALRVERE